MTPKYKKKMIETLDFSGITLYICMLNIYSAAKKVSFCHIWNIFPTGVSNFCLAFVYPELSQGYAGPENSRIHRKKNYLPVPG